MGCLCCAVLVAQLCLTPGDPMDCSLPVSSVHGDSPGQNPGLDCHALLQGIFPTQELNPGLLHCRQILYSLSHQGSPRILEWVTYPFSRGTSWPRNWTRISSIAVRFFTSWATREALNWSTRLYWCLLKRQLISYFSTPFSKGSRCSSRIHVGEERMMCV